MSILSEFREFALKGNVVDLAVGVVIGAAFGKIISSLVADVLMPVLGLATGGLDLSEHKWIMKEAATDAAGKVLPAVTLNYGTFIQHILDFVIIAFCIFAIIKLMNKLRRQSPQETAPVAPPEEVLLLTEIRDLLRRPI